MNKSVLRTMVMRYPFLRRLREEIFDPEMETILNFSPSRLKWLGIFTLIGHPLFWYVWSAIYAKPYENLWVRLAIACLGIGLFWQQTNHGTPSLHTRRYFSIVFWLQLPVFITWMYWLNQGDRAWLATVAAMILIYYHLTDWRLATIGLVLGALMAIAAAYVQQKILFVPSGEDGFVIAFCVFVSLTLATSSANQRRERIRHSLFIIGIMAHELRTPVATISLIGQAVRNEAANNDEVERVKHLEKMAFRLESLTRVINHHIDLQMINARFMQLPRVTQMISAEGLVGTAVKYYPYSSQREEHCVQLIVHEDFWFYGSERQFTQVINNLIKNALYSLKAAQSRLNPGDLRVELGVNSSTGKITVSDQGIGINAEHMTRIFEPFFSTSNDTGHGLGLAYCQQVVRSAGGFIRVKSEPAFGAIFTIDLPIQTVLPPTTPHDESSPIPPT